VGLETHGIFLFQMLLGVVSNVLVFLVARRFFGARTALLASFLALINAPFLFYETVLLRSTAIQFTGLLAIWLSARALDQPRPTALLAAGLALGLAVMVKTTALLFAAVVLAAPFFNRHRLRRRAACSAWLLAGLLAALLPVAARNLAVGVGAFSLSSVGAVTFLNANAPDFMPGTGFCISSYAARILAQTRDLVSVASATIGLHDSPFHYLLLLLRKFILFWSPDEIPNNININYYANFSMVLNLLLRGFLWVGLPALAGMVLAAANFRKHLLLYAYLFGGLVSATLFYNLSRFRSPMVAILLPFAAHALVELTGAVRTRRFARQLYALGAMSLLVLALWWARPDGLLRTRPADYVVGNQLWYELAREAASNGDPHKALETMSRALETEPEARPGGEVETSPRTSAEAREIAISFAKVHLACARFASQADRHARVEEHLARVRQLDAFIRSESSP